MELSISGAADVSIVPGVGIGDGVGSGVGVAVGVGDGVGVGVWVGTGFGSGVGFHPGSGSTGAGGGNICESISVIVFIFPKHSKYNFSFGSRLIFPVLLLSDNSVTFRSFPAIKTLFSDS